MADDNRATSLSRLDRRKVLLGLGLVAASGIAQARLPKPNRPHIPKGDLEKLVPNRVGDWQFVTESGLVLPPSDALSDRLYDNIVTRTYTNSRGQALMFLIAYNNRQDGVLQIHRPEFCYPAGGYALSPTDDAQIPLPGGRTLPAQIFSAKGQARDEVVLYWTRVGSHFPRRWSNQRLAVAMANLEGVIPDGLLARVSMIGGDVEQEAPLLKQFVADLNRQSPGKLNTLLFNSPEP